MSEIDDTAKAWFTAAIVNGRQPSTIHGGPLDGIHYFPEEIDGTDCLISEIGLLTPAEVSEHGGRLAGEEDER